MKQRVKGEEGQEVGTGGEGMEGAVRHLSGGDFASWSDGAGSCTSSPPMMLDTAAAFSFQALLKRVTCHSPGSPGKGCISEELRAKLLLTFSPLESVHPQSSSPCLESLKGLV